MQNVYDIMGAVKRYDLQEPYGIRHVWVFTHPRGFDSMIVESRDERTFKMRFLLLDVEKLT